MPRSAATTVCGSLGSLLLLVEETHTEETVCDRTRDGIVCGLQARMRCSMLCARVDRYRVTGVGAWEGIEAAR